MGLLVDLSTGIIIETTVIRIARKVIQEEHVESVKIRAISGDFISATDFHVS